MAKSFAPRIPKGKREFLDLSHRLPRDLLKNLEDGRFLEGAHLEEVKLSHIRVREQVRVTFDDASIRELAHNIEENGLIQPLVLHRSRGVLTLVCGERRFRAMTSLSWETAPCFILEGKDERELMAIQFSENSSRESLHYMDRALGILGYREATGASERQITRILGISKSEVHRSLIIAKIPRPLREAAVRHAVEKYVLLELAAMAPGPLRNKVEGKILAGRLTKRSTLKNLVRQHRKAQESSPTPPGSGIAPAEDVAVQ